jgi:hypothetical protein
MQILKNSNHNCHETKIKNGKPHLSAAQTIKCLNDALTGRDLNYFKTVNVERIQAAKFIERQAKILRFISISADLPTITKLVEDIYYSAFEESVFQEMPDYKEFREMLKVSEKYPPS